MEVIANTEGGFLIKATKEEVVEILSSVTGQAMETINIGQKIPAIDYAGTIKKLKSLPASYEYTQLMSRAEGVREILADLHCAVEAATKL